jgi:hypothetical protein
VPVNSGGKPMNESLSNANKEAASTNVESKQSISGSRPKEGQFPKSILIKLLNIYCQGQLELRDLLSCIVCSQRCCSCSEPSCRTEATAENGSGCA